MPLTDFHPTVSAWFEERFDAPTPPQELGWPHIRRGENVLIAAPTGSGKTLAGFLWAIDTLARSGDELPDETRVLYVSPLKALGNDVQKNLEGPLAELRERDPSLPELRALVRSGDTTSSARASMRRRPPHILVTTPESLFILLGSDGGRDMLRSVETVIVDEIHSVAGEKRGAHLALTLERLERLCGRSPQRIGLSATQRPLQEIARFLVGVDRPCEVVDAGHLRELDLGIELPPSELEAVCSHEVWDEIHGRMAELIEAHRSTLVFVSSRKLAERISARLSSVLGEERVTSHHGSLSKERRLDAERRLKEGSLRALVATATLELGIDIGDVDLVIQVGVPSSIATFLQRVGRSGHSLSKTPKGRLFPLTPDELVCAAGLLLAVRRGVLDPITVPRAPLDVLAQQLVAECVFGPHDEAELRADLSRAWPYRELPEGDFDAAVELHTQGRAGLLHRDGVGGRLRASKGARMAAVTSGGTIPDVADYRVVLEPTGEHVGSVFEDFAVEAFVGDVFQLGNASWQILKVEPGLVRVADARGAPPTLPFWVAEGPSRTLDLSAAAAEVLEHGTDEAWLRGTAELPEEVVTQISGFVREGETALSSIPTQRRLVAERFFDETGGQQLVIHSPFGGRVNRAFGLALRKRLCRSFGFELQAAATEESILVSLGPKHSFPIEAVFRFLKAATARAVLSQALLASPMFEARWRHNAVRSLKLPRFAGGKRVPVPLLRMRAQDLLADAFPDVLACGENLPGGDVPIPMEHLLVRQTVEDCLREAMDVDGFVRILEGLESGAIEQVAVDLPAPSAFARGAIHAMPYAFLDDAPLEERRTQAVITRRARERERAGDLGALDPEAVRRVREEAWPQPESAEDLHEALCWMGYLHDEEVGPWRGWLDELLAAGRVLREGDRFYAAEASRDPVETWRGRLEALGPVVSEEPALAELEARGAALRVDIGGERAYCERRLLARIHRYTLEGLRKAIEPVTAADYLAFLGRWQHAAPGHQLSGPRGLAEVVAQLAGFELPAAAWEADVLPSRVEGYERRWLDELTLYGEVVWGRLFGAADSALRATPVCLFPRADLLSWLGLAGPAETDTLGGHARSIYEALVANGPSFAADLQAASRRLPDHFEMGLTELIGRGLVTCDAFAGLRRLLIPPSRRPARVRKLPFTPPGRWAPLRGARHDPPEPEFVAGRLLARWGVVFRRMMERERVGMPWRVLHRALRRMELRGEVHGGRFVGGFAGEQFALPEAVRLLRKTRREAPEPFDVSAADPLNQRGILTPDPRVSPQAHQRVLVG